MKPEKYSKSSGFIGLFFFKFFFQNAYFLKKLYSFCQAFQPDG